MAVNKVDYEVLDSAKGVYANQAEAVSQIISTLNSTNANLQAGWTNQTADAFIQRYESEYKTNLIRLGEALQSISGFITSYVQNRMEEDQQSASALR